MEDQPLISPLLVADYVKDKKKETFALCLLPWISWQVHLFTGIRVYSFVIPVKTEDQMRHPDLLTEQVLDPWIFLWEAAISKLSGPQPVRYSYISNTYILSVLFL